MIIEPKSLEALLKEDALGELNRKFSILEAEWLPKFEPYNSITEACEQLQQSDLWQGFELDGECENPVAMKNSATLLGTSLEDLSEYVKLCKEHHKMIFDRMDIKILKEEWNELLLLSPLRELPDDDLFFEHIKTPIVVFYAPGDNLCSDIIKPTFARLLYYIKEVSLYYCFNDDLMAEMRISFVPSFVIHFPGEGYSDLCCSLGDSTEDMWQAMTITVKIIEEHNKDNPEDGGQNKGQNSSLN